MKIFYLIFSVAALAAAGVLLWQLWSRLRKYRSGGEEAMSDEDSRYITLRLKLLFVLIGISCALSLVRSIGELIVLFQT